MKNGRRWSSANAYLHEAIGCDNLTVITGAEAEWIEFDGRKATGIRVRRHGKSQVIRLQKELLHSAGDDDRRSRSRKDKRPALEH